MTDKKTNMDENMENETRDKRTETVDKETETGEHKLSETWAQDALADLEDWIEEQGIYIRQ